MTNRLIIKVHLVKNYTVMKIIFFLMSLSFSIVSCNEAEETVTPIDTISNSELRVQEPIIVPCNNIEIICLQTQQSEYVIQNNDQYQDLLKSTSPHPDCRRYELPDIDFSKNTLIGYHSIIAGCEIPKIDKTVYKENNQNYTIVIEVTQIGTCERGNSINIWCLIPKINLDAKVTFEEKVN